MNNYQLAMFIGCGFIIGFIAGSVLLAGWLSRGSTIVMPAWQLIGRSLFKGSKTISYLPQSEHNKALTENIEIMFDNETFIIATDKKGIGILKDNLKL